MKKFADGWIQSMALWAVFFLSFMYGATIGGVRPDSGNAVLISAFFAHLYAAHLGALGAIALWLWLFRETPRVKYVFYTIGTLLTLAYLLKYWGVSPTPIDMGINVHLSGVSFGFSVIYLLWLIKYVILPELREFFLR